MSTISTVYDNLITLIPAKLPAGYVRLPNAYKIHENDETYLKQGFCVGFGHGKNTERLVGNKLTIQRALTLTLTRKLYSLEHAAAGKAATEKLLFEDQLILIQNFETDPTLNQSAMLTKYQSDNGMEYVYNGKDEFIMIQSLITVDYLEPLLAY